MPNFIISDDKKIEEITPIFYNFSDFKDANILIDKNIKKQTSINENQYREIFHQLINQELFFKKDAVLKKIHEDIYYLYDFLKPIEKLFHQYDAQLNIMMFGRSVADFILAHHINDLNPYRIQLCISLSLMNGKSGDYAQKIINSSDLLGCFSQSELLNLNILNEPIVLSFKKIIHAYIEKNILLNNIKKIEEEILLSSISTMYYPGQIGKITDIIYTKKLINYSLDIVVIPWDGIACVKRDQFDMLKCYFKIVDENNIFPTHHQHLISRFRSSFDFFADIFHKKITIDLSHEKYEHFNNLTKKALEIQKKHKEFEIIPYLIKGSSTGLKDDENLLKEFFKVLLHEKLLITLQSIEIEKQISSQKI